MTTEPDKLLVAEIARWKAVVAHDCDTEEQVKNIARPILGERVDGSPDGVPNEADLAEMLVAEIARLKEALAAADALVTAVESEPLRRAIAAYRALRGEA